MYNYILKRTWLLVYSYRRKMREWARPPGKFHTLSKQDYYISLITRVLGALVQGRWHVPLWHAKTSLQGRWHSSLWNEKTDQFLQILVNLPAAIQFWTNSWQHILFPVRCSNIMWIISAEIQNLKRALIIITYLGI